jgi:hypothetical protein
MYCFLGGAEAPLVVEAIVRRRERCVRKGKKREEWRSELSN